MQKGYSHRYTLSPYRSMTPTYRHELWIKDIGQLGVPSTTEAKGLQQQIANYSVCPVMQAI